MEQLEEQKEGERKFPGKKERLMRKMPLCPKCMHTHPTTELGTVGRDGSWV